MNIFSTVLALAVVCLVVEFTSPAPLSRRKERDRDAKKSVTDKLLDKLQLLLEKRAMTMAINKVLATKEDKTWQYPPQLIQAESNKSKGETPMKKAARRHFKVSEPGTGPILNLPQSHRMGSDRETMEILLGELMSAVK